eukprot:TRINITY_DN26065_c0_g4_i1.p1 TRINITY_DN26065_c0_g4~~TRINITY_DN26065_c0_g4_i1.p1  ORF type:complete len:335 (+),score=72.77 TRINITY_DN26065_c0_g4_i1:46-1050(+)
MACGSRCRQLARESAAGCMSRLLCICVLACSLRPYCDIRHRESRESRSFTDLSGAALGGRRVSHSRLVARAAVQEVAAAAQARQELQEETQQLRQSLHSLVSELRLLREELEWEPGAPSVSTEEASTSDAGSSGSPARSPAPAREQAARPEPPASPVSTPAQRGGDATVARKKPPAGKTAVKVVSAGGDAGNIADFFLDDQKVPIGGMAGRRGVNVVVIDPYDAQVISAKAYDVWGNALDENRRFAKDIRALEEDYIVLVAVKDSGGENLDRESLHALESIGSTLESRLEFRQGYALIGRKDGEAMSERKGPMVMAEVTLPFAVRSPQSPVRAR